MTRQADLLIVATGQPKLIQTLHVKPGAVVVDVGIHRGQDGKIGGDCDWDSLTKVASAATPVPGGVGPMTIALLMANTVLAAEKRQGIASH
jgi:methylenetetrahydrofolate dehydrogenase (NADP+)/methenyltetrahydrofolate cyclohydrolase